MINLTPIPTRIQERMREKMDALGRDTPYFPDSESPTLTQEKMLSRSPFMKIVSGQKNPVILMGGELIAGNTDSAGNPVFGFEGDHLASGFDEIYGSRGDNVNSDKRPMPGIKSMSATFQGGMAARREATISWTCWSFDDINRLMPHFLAHGKTVMIQWGWVYDKNSLTKIPSFTDGKNKIEASAFNSNYLIDVIDADGDFDMMTGVIKNFSFTARQDGGFDCETIITSIGINILKSTEGTVSSIDPVITYNLSSQQSDEKKQFLIKEATGKISEDENSKLIRLNSSISLKIFLKNINSYVVDVLLKEPYNNNYIEDTDWKRHFRDDTKGSDKIFIRYAPFKFLLLTQTQGKSDDNQLNTFVRWGWFEDNILSKFLSVTNKDGKVVSEFRSIERELDNDSKPKLVDGKAIFNSTK